MDYIALDCESAENAIDHCLETPTPKTDSASRLRSVGNPHAIGSSSISNASEEGMSADQIVANGDDVPRALDLKTWQNQKTLLNRLTKLIKRNPSIPRLEKLELKAIMLGFRQTLMKNGRVFNAEQGDQGPGHVKNKPAPSAKPDPRSEKRERKRARHEVNKMARRLSQQLRIKGDNGNAMEA